MSIHSVPQPCELTGHQMVCHLTFNACILCGYVERSPEEDPEDVPVDEYIPDPDYDPYEYPENE